MIAKIKSVVRRYGVWGVLQNLAAKCLAKIGLRIHRMWILSHALDEGVVAKQLPAFEALSLADFEAHRADDPAWFTERKMAQLARSFKVPATRAFGCFVEGRLVAYGFTSERYMGYSHRRLEEGDGYLWDDYTHPAHRGEGWHGVMIRIREEVLRQAGKRRSVSIVSHFNRASYRGFRRVGYTLLERYSYGKRWGKPFMTMRYGIAPKK